MPAASSGTQECADPSRAAARRAGPRPHYGETGLCGETRRGLLAVQNVGVTVAAGTQPQVCRVGPAAGFCQGDRGDNPFPDNAFEVAVNDLWLSMPRQDRVPDV